MHFPAWIMQPVTAVNSKQYGQTYLKWRFYLICVRLMNKILDNTAPLNSQATRPVTRDWWFRIDGLFSVFS